MKKPKAKYPTVMLVDDNEIDNFINQKMIEATDFSEKIFTYTSGKSALEFLKNLEKNKELIDILVPDYIFLDINMPVMDGFEFLEAYEQLPVELQASIIVVMLTSSLHKKDMKRAQANKSLKGFIHKPLSKEEMKKIISQIKQLEHKV